ncbi:MAG TPA: YcxB family protein, partial [Candidatus Binatia bacterium]|nr:YcxB family protein [Candidatus Binatia bacterium]
HLVEIPEDAFYEETRFNRSYYYWPGIRGAIRRAGFIAVYVNPHAAHLIPERAFATAEEATQFFAAVKAKLGK